MCMSEGRGGGGGGARRKLKGQKSCAQARTTNRRQARYMYTPKNRPYRHQTQQIHLAALASTQTDEVYQSCTRLATPPGAVKYTHTSQEVLSSLIPYVSSAQLLDPQVCSPLFVNKGNNAVEVPAIKCQHRTLPEDPNPAIR